MNAKVIVLPKRDFNYKLKLESNDNWKKKGLNFLGLSVRENTGKPRLTSYSFPDPLYFASLCWWPLLSLFWRAFVFPLAWLIARYSLLLTPFIVLFRVSFVVFFLLSYSSYVLSNFLVRFSRLALRLLLLAFFGRSVSFFSAHLNFLRLTKL